MSLEFGGTRVIAEVANGLSARGHEVKIVLPYGACIAWPVHAELVWVAQLNATSIPSCDIILPNFYTTVFPAYQSRRGRCVRLSLGYEPLWIGNSLAEASYELPIPVIAISAWQGELIRAKTGRQVHLLHPGVDPVAFHPRPKPGDGLRRLLYLMRGAGYFYKGNEIFAAAHEILAGIFPDLLVTIIPAGGRSDLVYPHPCIWRGAPDDAALAGMYAEADIFVYPSKFESFGLPGLEAMACGTALVATDCGGIREYARHLENCLLVRPDDPYALASTIASLFNDGATRRMLIEGGLRTAGEWSWQRTYREIEDILFRVLH